MAAVGGGVRAQEGKCPVLLGGVVGRVDPFRRSCQPQGQGEQYEGAVKSFGTVIVCPCRDVFHMNENGVRENDQNGPPQVIASAARARLGCGVARGGAVILTETDGNDSKMTVQCRPGLADSAGLKYSNGSNGSKISV
jgi:hypothetical protein